VAVGGRSARAVNGGSRSDRGTDQPWTGGVLCCRPWRPPWRR
jgi:hypothetical protein